MKVNMTKIHFLTVSLLISNMAFATGDRAEPFEYRQYQPILSKSKLQASDPNGKSGNKSEYGKGGNFKGVVSEHFYVDKASEALIFSMKGHKNRSEVRVLDNFDTSLPNTFYHLTADVLPINPQASIKDSTAKDDSMTYLQVHNSGDGTSTRGTSGEGYIPHPLLRVVYEAERSGKKDHYWAIIKNNAVDCGSKSGNKATTECKNAYVKFDLGPVDFTTPTNFDVAVGNSQLVITVDGTEKVNHDIGYWKEKYSYFKAGVYNQFKNGTSEVHFTSLDYKIENK